MDWEFGISGYKLVYIGWVNNKVRQYSTGNYIQYLVTTYDGKESEKGQINTPETNTTLHINYTSIKRTVSDLQKCDDSTDVPSTHVPRE